MGLKEYLDSQMTEKGYLGQSKLNVESGGM